MKVITSRGTTNLTRGHEAVDGACGAETRGPGEGVTSCNLHVSGKWGGNKSKTHK